jgi:hypothetical protein
MRPIVSAGFTSPAGRHVADADQPRALVDQLRQRGGVELAVLVVGHDHHLDARTLRDLQVGKDVAAVFGPPSQDAIAASQRHRVERRVPGMGGVVEERHLVAPTANEFGDGVVRRGDVGFRRSGRRVAADLCLEQQVAAHGVERRLRHQRGTGVVEVDPVRAPRGQGAQGVDVHMGILVGSREAVSRSTPRRPGAIIRLVSNNREDSN